MKQFNSERSAQWFTVAVVVAVGLVAAATIDFGWWPNQIASLAASNEKRIKALEEKAEDNRQAIIFQSGRVDHQYALIRVFAVQLDELNKLAHGPRDAGLVKSRKSAINSGIAPIPPKDKK